MFIDRRHTVRGNRNPYQVLHLCVRTTLDLFRFVLRSVHDDNNCIIVIVSRLQHFPDFEYYSKYV